MAFVSITRLRVRAWYYLPSFLWHALASQRQLKRSAGFVQGALSNAPGRVFWTASVWSDDAAMKRFRDTAAHKIAMPKLLDFCDEASLAHWAQDTDHLPGPSDMLDRLQSIGRLSKVRHPSPGQQAGKTVPDGRPPRPSRPFTPTR